MRTGLFQGMVPTIVAEFFLIALFVASTAVLILGLLALRNLSSAQAEQKGSSPEKASPEKEKD